MKIRKAESADVSSLSLLMNEGFGWQISDSFSSSFLSSDHITCLIAENEKGEVMGTASLHLLQKIDRKLGIIEDVVVFKKYRGKAVGVRIIEELIQLSKNKNCYKVILNTKEDNLSYYEKIGFTKKQLQMELRHR
jgi:glucosamine-phosphate N-acetyltransferase|tara:strand:- start:1644 stop:2048 length:405 start_codon:yes stop_codon:yes gene_type:complete